MEQVKINIYDFKELDKKIQERLIKDEAETQADIYYETLLNNDMQDYACKLLRDNFKDVLFLDVYYDLSYTQVNGAMIEFDINIEALNNKYKMLTKKEIEKIEETGFTTISVKHWGNYCHALSFDIDYQDYTFYIDNFDKTQEKLDKMIKKFKEDIIDINEQLTKKGYEFMDFVSDRETLIDILEENKYLKNGTIYNCGFADVQDNRTVMNKEKIKDLIYKVEQEVDNELDEDYESDYKKDLTEQDFNMLSEFLKRFTHKLDLTIDDEMRLESEEN